VVSTLNERNFLSIICLILFPIFTASCATTTLKSEWTDAAFPKGHLKKVLAVGIFYSSEERKIFEDELGRQMNARNVNVISSYTIFGEDHMPDKEELAKAVKSQGVDSVLVGRMIKVRDLGTYSEPSIVRLDTDNLFGYYLACCQLTVSSGRDIVIEIKIFEAAHDKLIWSVMSSTLLDGPFEKTVESLISVITKDLYSKQLIR
jgi:hypothetical protein